MFGGWSTEKVVLVWCEQNVWFVHVSTKIVVTTWNQTRQVSLFEVRLFWHNHQPDSHAKQSNPMHDATELWSLDTQHIDMFGKLSMLVFKSKKMLQTLGLIFVYQFLIWAYRTVLMWDILVEHPLFEWYIDNNVLLLLVRYRCCWCSNTAPVESNWDLQYVWQYSNEPSCSSGWCEGVYPSTRKRHLEGFKLPSPLSLRAPQIQGKVFWKACCVQDKWQKHRRVRICMGWAVGLSE